MATIVRDRVQEMVKKGMTLAQRQEIGRCIGGRSALMEILARLHKSCGAWVGYVALPGLR